LSGYKTNGSLTQRSLHWAFACETW